MIKSFRQKWVERVFYAADPIPVGFPMHLQEKLKMKLMQIEAASSTSELRIPPGNRLEKLTGSRKSEWSIRVNDQWRVCFSWRSGNAHEVSVEDYH